MANITAAEHPKLVLEMTAMERTTPAHYDEWNVRHQQLYIVLDPNNQVPFLQRLLPL